MWSVSPSHGRSFVVGKTPQGRYIVSKGNGLSYTQYVFINTREFDNDTWGLLLLNDALRDYDLGCEIAALGIKTNRMEYVLQLQHNVQLSNGRTIQPTLLQYTVECPYRLTDATIANSKEIWKEVAKWEQYNTAGRNKSHLVAAEVLTNNLRTLHSNGVLHNAIQAQNYTWALELLDFELACSPKHPYQSEEDNRHVQDLFPREVMYTYQIITHIATVLCEDIDFAEIDDIFMEKEFDLSELKV